jgi:hypothetical protein
VLHYTATDRQTDCCSSLPCSSSFCNKVEWSALFLKFEHVLPEISVLYFIQPCISHYTALFHSAMYLSLHCFTSFSHVSLITLLYFIQPCISHYTALFHSAMYLSLHFFIPSTSVCVIKAGASKQVVTPRGGVNCLFFLVCLTTLVLAQVTRVPMTRWLLHNDLQMIW